MQDDSGCPAECAPKRFCLCATNPSVSMGETLTQRLNMTSTTPSLIPRIIPITSCARPPSWLCLLRVSRLKPFVALLVLALWATCMVRCELVSLAAAEADSCCDTGAEQCPAAPAPANQCVCSLTLSGGIIAEKSTVPLPLLVGLPLFTVPTELEIPRPAAPARAWTFSPPELQTTWQFSFRAALSPRAPSFVS